MLNENSVRYICLNRKICKVLSLSHPNLAVLKEFKVLKALQQRISNDIQQSEIIVNYLTEKYGSDLAKFLLCVLKETSARYICLNRVICKVFFFVSKRITNVS